MPELTSKLRIHTMEEEQNILLRNKNRFWDILLGLLKWIIGTVGLGLVGICINQSIQETELKIKRMDADTQLLKVVTRNLDHNRTDSLEFRYLSFVKTFITTYEIKEEVKYRIDELGYNLSLMAKKEADQANKKQFELAKKQIDDPLRDRLIQGEKELKSLGNGGVNIEDLVSKENIIANNVISIDSSTIATLNPTQEIIAPVTISKGKTTYKLIGVPVTKWCKEGYYVEYNNTLRLGINNLNSQSMIVNIKDIENKEIEPILIEDEINLVEGETHKAISHNYQYVISLSYIGSAGKNPFSKAAYITVSTYMKQNKDLLWNK